MQLEGCAGSLLYDRELPENFTYVNIHQIASCFRKRERETRKRSLYIDAYIHVYIYHAHNYLMVSRKKQLD